VKLDRLLAITMLLLNNEMITAKELSEKFEVSVRTIYRDVDAICAAGIPIVSYQGNSGGFSIMDGFKIDKRLLSSYDVESLIVVLRGVSSIFKNNKYEGTLSVLEGLNNKIDKQSLMLDFTSWSPISATSSLLNKLRTAIDDYKVINFNYTNGNGENSYREVEPITLLLKSGYWYLHGYCKTRSDCRLFKLSRMRNLNLTDEKFILEKSKIKEIRYYWEDNHEVKLIDLELKFSSKVCARAMDYFFSDDMNFTEHGSLIIKICYPEDEWIYSTLLSFGSDVEVIKPTHLREIIKSKATEIIALYNNVE
jgi:predicted DNA-binding transcriptional regulator YafY